MSTVSRRYTKVGEQYCSSAFTITLSPEYWYDPEYLAKHLEEVLHDAHAPIQAVVVSNPDRRTPEYCKARRISVGVGADFAGGYAFKTLAETLQTALEILDERARHLSLDRELLAATTPPTTAAE